MEILFYVCFAAVLLILGGIIAIFLTTSDEDLVSAGYNRNPQPWFVGYSFKPGNRLYSVRFMKIDGELRRFDEFIVTEVVGKCVVGFEIPNNKPPQKRSFNVDRLISCVR
jgi:hypothetical protein